MREAIKEIIKFAEAKMDIVEVSAHIFIDNIKSLNLVRNLNFLENGSYNEIFQGKEYFHHIYTLWLGSNRSRTNCT